MIGKWLSGVVFGIVAITGVFAAAQSAHAQARVYYCSGNKLSSILIPSRSEEDVAVVVGLNPKPDTVRKLFAEPPAAYDRKLGVSTFSTMKWERRGEMYRKCKETGRACADQQSGNAVATLAGSATAHGGEGQPTCEKEYTVRTAKCTAEGNLVFQELTGTARLIKGFTGADIPVQKGGVLYTPPVSGGNPTWRFEGDQALIHECEGENASGPRTIYVALRDGLWRITETGQEITDCPMKQALMSSDKMAIKNAEKQVRWSNPAHPLDLLGNNAGFTDTWQNRGDDWHVRHEVAPEGVSGAPAGIIRVVLDRYFDPVDAETVNLENRLQVLVPEQFARIAGFDGECRFTITAQAKFIR